MDKKIFDDIKAYILKDNPKNSYYNRAVIKYALECVDILEDYAESHKDASLKQVFKLSNVLDYPYYIDNFIRTHNGTSYSKRDIVRDVLDQSWRGCSAFDYLNDDIAECLPPSKRSYANVQRMIDYGYTNLLLRSYNALRVATYMITKQYVYENDVDDLIEWYLERNDVKALQKCLAIYGISHFIKKEQIAKIPPL